MSRRGPSRPELSFHAPEGRVVWVRTEPSPDGTTYLLVLELAGIVDGIRKPRP